MVWFATLVREKEDSQKVVEWALTSKCNLRCKHCYMGSGCDNLDELSNSEKKKLAYRISEHAKNVVLSGGEPLLSHSLFEVVEILTSSCNVFLATNGTVYNDEIIEKIARSGIKAVQVSIDYNNEELHDKFRGKSGSWKRTLEFIKRIRSKEIPVIVCMTIMRNNYKELRSFADTMKKLGVCSIYLTRFIPVGRGEEYCDLVLQDEQEKDFLDHYLKPLVQENKQFISTNIPQWNLYIGTMGEKSVGCSMGHILFIDSGGEVFPCPMVNISLGNIKEKGLSEFYNLKIMKELKARENVGGVCKKCDYLENCSGCCAWSSYKDKHMYDRGNCWIAKKMKMNKLSSDIF